LSTLVLAIASAGVEFADINRAKSTWDPSEASEVGLKWSTGGAAYSESYPSRRQTLKPVLVLAVFPCVQLLAIIAGTTPLISRYFKRRREERDHGFDSHGPAKVGWLPAFAFWKRTAVSTDTESGVCVKTVQVPVLGMFEKGGTRSSVDVGLAV
jgi:hypothetical protein